MRYVSVFSGVEAATLAWHQLGWEPVAFSEIDPFPSAVLAERFPHVPNLGDITQIDWSRIGAVDLVVGGSPCQSFSVVGKREGSLARRDSCSSTFDAFVSSVLAGLSGRTSRERSRVRAGRLSGSSSQKWMTSGTVSHGEFWTRSSSEWPSDAAVCSLPEVLETGGRNELARFYLSPRACDGILRRAAKRGKPLPPELKMALEAQAGA